MKKIILMAGIALLAGCGGAGTAEQTYEEKIAQASELLSSGEFSAAIAEFEEARAMDPERPETYAGLGWGYFRNGDLSEAGTAFETGITKPEPGADMHAGLAFVRNAQKNYAASNSEAVLTLAAAADWTLTYGLGVDYKDLYLLKAENHFLIGEYTQSLFAVKILQPSFSPNLATPEGIALLAQKIESLKALTKRTSFFNS